MSASSPLRGQPPPVSPAAEALLFPTQLWTPPTPPQDDNDIYIDSVMCLMYETTPIPESKLPPVYVRRERRRHKTDPSGGLCGHAHAPEGSLGQGRALSGWARLGF